MNIRQALLLSLSGKKIKHNSWGENTHYKYMYYDANFDRMRYDSNYLISIIQLSTFPENGWDEYKEDSAGRLADLEADIERLKDRLANLEGGGLVCG